MNILGENVILRAIEPKDNKMLLELINDADTEYMLGGWSFPVSEKDQGDWINQLNNDKDTLRCVIDFQGKALGAIMLTNIDYKNGNAEVHVKLALNEARGKGYGTDALKAITAYAFNELRLKCLYARVNQQNEASKALFKKCGFFEEGTLKCRLFKRGEFLDVISFSIINKKVGF